MKVYKVADDIIDEYETGLKSVDALYRYSHECVLIAGGMIGFDKGLSVFLNRYAELEGNLFLLSEVMEQFRNDTAEKIRFPYICTPHLMGKEGVVYGIDMPVSQKMEQLLRSRKYLREARDNIYLRHPRLGEGYPTVWTYYSYLYLRKLLEKLCPKKVILWNEFYAFHIILCGLCKEMHIPMEFMEFGCLPGSLVIEKKGQQGESLVSRHYRKFRRLAVSSDELRYAEKLISYLRDSKLNRNVQPPITIGNIKLEHFDPNKKTILYLGQNDYESGLQPYTVISRLYHSPSFKTSMEALGFLSKIAKINNWNLIFKPHPIMTDLGLYSFDGNESFDVVNHVDLNSLIDFCDVTVTILSQGSYISLIREKPVVMLGYNQLRGKECTYDAYNKAVIERRIREAIQKGYTTRQKENLRLHVAQLVKYVLYDDGTDKLMQIGRIL